MSRKILNSNLHESDDPYFVYQKSSTTHAVLQRANALMAKYAHAKKTAANHSKFSDYSGNSNKVTQSSKNRFKGIALELNSDLSISTDSEKSEQVSSEQKNTSEENVSSKDSGRDEFVIFKEGTIQWLSDNEVDDDLSNSIPPMSGTSSSIKDAAEENSSNFCGQRVHIFSKDILGSVTEDENVMDGRQENSNSKGISDHKSLSISEKNDSKFKEKSSRKETPSDDDRQESIEEDMMSIKTNLSHSSSSTVVEISANNVLDNVHLEDNYKKKIEDSSSDSGESENFAKGSWTHKNKRIQTSDIINDIMASTNSCRNLKSGKNASPVITEFHSPPFLIGPTNSSILETLITVHGAKALLSYHPGLMALNEMMKLQLQRSEQWFETQKQLHHDMIKSINEDYKYATWESTQKILKKGRKSKKIKAMDYKHRSE